MNPWVQSLRVDAAPTGTLRNNTSSSTRRLGPSLPTAVSTSARTATTKPRGASTLQTMRDNTTKLCSTRRLAPSSLPGSTKSRTALASKPEVMSMDAGANGALVSSHPKCLNLCCHENFLERRLEFSQPVSGPYFYIDGAEADRIMDELAPIEALHDLLANELTRLKRLRAAQPPPRTAAISEDVACMHVCCKSSLYGRPTASSSERLNHIIRKLRLRSQECTQFLTRATRSLWSICRLPPELLQEVFMFVVESATHARVSAPSTGRVPTTIDAIPLAHVCRYWRTLALDMSQLWATIQPPSIAAMSYLDFYLARVTPAPIPLTIICDCHQTSESVLDKMAHLSHRWRSLTLREYSDEIQSTLDHICDRIPLLECLRLSVVYELPILFTTSVFLDAPSLRHVDIALTSIYGLLRLTSFILPWRQLTFLTLKPILVSAFSEILRECPRLVYFNAEITYGGTHDGLPEIHTLTKLVLYGPRSEQAFCAHRFPQLLSLSIVINEPHIQPRLFESLVQSSHLEFLRMEARYAFQADDLITCCLHPPVELLLATPSLRIMVTRGRWRNSRLAMVTPRFDTPLVVRLPDDPFPPVAPWSLAEANAAKGRCNTFEATALLATVEARMKRDPSFDPYGIERTRLIDPEGKDELDYLDYL